MTPSFSNLVKNTYLFKNPFKQQSVHFVYAMIYMFLFVSTFRIFLLGTTFLYSTHAFTLLSAVMERAAERRFLDLMMTMFRDLGMLNTVPDENDSIIYHRSRSDNL